MNQKKNIYLDYAAATPLDEAVLAAMEPWLRMEYGNPSSVHAAGLRARQAIDEARAQITAILNCAAAEIIFTSGGTESDNLAILGSAHYVGQGSVLMSAIEHPAVLAPARELQEQGFTVATISVNKDGIIDQKKFVAAVAAELAKNINATPANTSDSTKNTNNTPSTNTKKSKNRQSKNSNNTPNNSSLQNFLLISIMLANNEIGTIQPIAELTRQARELVATSAPEQATEKTATLYFHTDACQAAGFLDLDVQKLGVDMLTLNGSKIYGPRGAGLLYIKKGVELEPLFYGGHQEQSLRPGTENTAAIVGLAKALELAAEQRQKETARLTALRDKLIQGILQNIPGTKLNGSTTERLPNNANIFFAKIDGEALLFALDQAGIQVSLGSACASGVLDPSHVLLAMGLTPDQARQCARFSLGRHTTAAEIDRVLAVLPDIVKKLRQL